LNHFKRIVASVLCGAAMITPFASLTANAATFAQINADSVFVDQQTSYTCTLASNVMMLRRAALMLGDPNWMFITEKNCRPTIWSEYGGMICDYKYNGSIKTITVINRRVDELGGKSNPKQFFINMLKEHPEGVVIYDYDRPHAILLTDYTDGQFYCSDPWYELPTKRIPISQASISVESAESVWYIVSPDLHLTTGSTNTSTTTSSSVTNVNETWQVNDEAGLNLRSDAGISNAIIGFVPNKSVVNVTKKKAASGYTWGYVSYNSKNGWIALDYAKQIKNEQPANTETKTEVAFEDTHNYFNNTSSISASDIILGDTIEIKGSADSGNAPYTYAYYYKRTYSTSWTTIKGFSSDNKASVQPLTATTYDLCVKIKDAKGRLEKKYFKFEVHKPLVNKSAATKSFVYVGDEINIKGKASGGIGSYSYAYFYKRHEDTGWVKISDFSAETTASFKPLKDTDHDICVKVKDSTGKVEQIFSSVKVYPKFVNSSKIASNSIKLGQTVSILAVANGGSGEYEYAFYYKKAQDESWTAINEFGRCLRAEFTPKKATAYDICVKIKDSNGRVEKKYFTLTVKSN